jgi:hypothetical protein
MSIKFYPLGNFPVSSSFSVTSSFSEVNLGELLTTSASFAEVTAFSIRPAPRGAPGREQLIDSRERDLIELIPD